MIHNEVPLVSISLATLAALVSQIIPYKKPAIELTITGLYFHQNLTTITTSLATGET